MPKSGNMSKMVQDGHGYSNRYDLSNNAISDDLEWHSRSFHYSISRHLECDFPCSLRSS